MRRRVLLLVVAMLGACARRGAHPFEPPPAMPGGWSLRGVKQQSGKMICSYGGPGALQVEVEDTGSFAKALGRTQTTRSEANMVFFNKGNYFAVVRWREADRDALRAFVKDLENRLQ